MKRYLAFARKVLLVILMLGAFYVFLDAAYRAFTDPIVIRNEPARAMEIIIEQKEIVSATISAYTSSEDETDASPWINASGGRPGHGSVACPARLEFGQRILIASKEYVCDDRMAKRYRDVNFFDIWVETKAEAFEFGRQEIEVEIL